MTDLPPRPVYPVGVPPEVCDKFDELALGLADGSLSWHRFKCYSADAILYRIRWHFTVEKRTARAFKINNKWSPPLARWWMEIHPEYLGFFETRERPLRQQAERRRYIF